MSPEEQANFNRILAQFREAQVYITTLARELALCADERERLAAEVRDLRAELTDSIPVEIVDIPTVQRTTTRRTA